MPPYFWLGVFKGLEKLSILILEYYLRFFNSGRLAVVVPLTINELIKAKANELRAKKGYEVKGAGANKEFISLNNKNTKS